MKVQASFVKDGRHSNRLFEVRPGDIVDAVLERTVRAHIVDHAFRSYNDAVSALLDSLHVVVQPVVCQDAAVSLDPYRLPEAAQVGRTGTKGLSAADENRRRHLAEPAARGSLRDRYLVRLHHVNVRYSLPISVRAVASSSGASARPLISNVIRFNWPVKANGGS